MRAVLQRVTHASVEVDEAVVGQIGAGLVVLLGVATNDVATDVRFLTEKICTLRIFSDERGKMNRSLLDMGGAVLLVSQFTLLARTANGRRPSFEEAASPDEARRLYEQLGQELREQGIKVETGVFSAHMRVTLLNDGPVTIVLDSRQGWP